MKFNVNKCNVMHIGHQSKLLAYKMQDKLLEVTEVEKDLGVTFNNKLKSVINVELAVYKAKRMLGFIKRSITSRRKEVILPLYRSLVRPHLEYCVQAWGVYLQKDRVELEKVQMRAVRLIQGLKSDNYFDKLRELGLFSMVRRRLRGDLIECFKILKGMDRVQKDNFFQTRESSGSMRGHRFKLYKKQCRTDLRKFFFTNRVVDIWNSLPAEVVESSTLGSFKSSVDKFFNKIGIV